MQLLPLPLADKDLVSFHTSTFMANTANSSSQKQYIWLLLILDFSATVMCKVRKYVDS